MNEELRKKNLQQLDDASAIWQALKEVLDEATDMSVASAISDGIAAMTATGVLVTRRRCRM